MANPILSTDPGAYQTTEEHEVIGNAFETLVTTDTQGNLVPLLCERWTPEEGGRMVRLELRRGIDFSDGSPVTAAAVKASLERSIRVSRDASPAAFVSIEGVAEYLEGKSPEVTGIRAPAEDRLEIRLVDARSFRRS
jgi:peptide/nickel transport system substrate-binding protein